MGPSGLHVPCAAQRCRDGASALDPLNPRVQHRFPRDRNINPFFAVGCVAAVMRAYLCRLFRDSGLALKLRVAGPKRTPAGKGVACHDTLAAQSPPASAPSLKPSLLRWAPAMLHYIHTPQSTRSVEPPVRILSAAVVSAGRCLLFKDGGPNLQTCFVSEGETCFESAAIIQQYTVG